MFKTFSGAGFEGPGKVTKAIKSQTKFILMRVTILKSSPADLRPVLTLSHFFYLRFFENQNLS
jgi:hypothetical protein